MSQGKILSFDDEPGGTMRLTMELEGGRVVVFTGCKITGFNQTYEPNDSITVEEVKFVPVSFPDKE